jgi:Polyglycine hydrolase-like, structural repeat
VVSGPSDAFEHSLHEHLEPDLSAEIGSGLSDRIDLDGTPSIGGSLNDRIDIDLGPHVAALRFVAWRSAHGLPGDAFKARFDELVNGYRLTDISGFWDGTERFSGIWEEADGLGWRAHWGLPIGDYQNVFNDMTGQGFRPVRLSFYATPNGPHVCALWLADGSPPAWVARHDMTRDAYQEEFNQLAAAGYRGSTSAATSKPGKPATSRSGSCSRTRGRGRPSTTYPTTPTRRSSTR